MLRTKKESHFKVMRIKEKIKEAKKYGLNKTHVLRLTVKKKAKLKAEGYACEDYATPFGAHQTCIRW